MKVLEYVVAGNVQRAKLLYMMAMREERLAGLTAEERRELHDRWDAEYYQAEPELREV